MYKLIQALLFSGFIATAFCDPLSPGVTTSGNYLIGHCGSETVEVSLTLNETQRRLQQVIHSITDIHPDDMTDAYYAFFNHVDRNVVSSMLNNIVNGTAIPAKGHPRRPALRCFNPGDHSAAEWTERCKEPGTHILTTKSEHIVVLCPSFLQLQQEAAKKDCIQNIGPGNYLPISKVEDHRLTVLTEALVRMYLHGAENGKEVPDVDGCLALGRGQLEGKDPAVNPRSYGFYVGNIVAGCNCYDGPQYRGPPRTLENP